MDIKKGVTQLSTKENILALFEENKGIYFSGEEIAVQLSVSRAAVWKAVNALRSDGYVIDAVPNKGYRLSMNTDILSSLPPLSPESDCLRTDNAAQTFR